MAENVSFYIDSSDGNPIEQLAKSFTDKYDSFVIGACEQFKNEPPAVLYKSKKFCELVQLDAFDQDRGETVACEFLYGNDTRKEHIESLREAITRKTYTRVSMVLYKTNGHAFIGCLEVIPIFNHQRIATIILVSLTIVVDLKNDDLQGSHILLPHEKIKDYLVKRSNRNILKNKNRSITKQFDAEQSCEINHGQTSKAKSQKCMIKHDNHFKILWDWVIVGVTFYIAVVTPYNASFIYGCDEVVEGHRSYRCSSEGGMKVRTEALVIDVFVSILFITDIVLNFRTIVVDRGGRVISDPKEIAQRYLIRWFWIDVTSAIPYDFIYAFGVNTYTNKAIIFLKLLRCLRCVRLWNKVSRYTHYAAVILLINLVAYVLVAHWMACAWYYIGRKDYSDSTDPFNLGWLANLNRRITNRFLEEYPNYEATPTLLYVTSLYFTLSMMTSVGFGNESPNTLNEKIFSILTMLIGALMHAVIFGNVTAIIQRYYARRFSYDMHSNEIKDFYRIYRIPSYLKRKIQKFYETVWSANRGINYVKIIQDFPDDLKEDVSTHIYNDFLELLRYPGAPNSLLKSVAMELKQRHVHKGEYILNAGDILSQIVFIYHGSLDVIKDKDVLLKCGEKSLLGADLLSQNSCLAVKSGYSVRAASNCNLHIINNTALTNLLCLYPEFALQCAQLLDQRLTFNLKNNQNENFDSMQLQQRFKQLQSCSSLNDLNRCCSFSSNDLSNPSETADFSDNKAKLKELSQWMRSIDKQMEKLQSKLDLIIGDARQQQTRNIKAIC